MDLAKLTDIDRIMEITKSVVQNMRDNGFEQWTDDYPNVEVFTNDINRNELFVYKEDGVVLGMICVTDVLTPSYETVAGWNDDKAIVIHRIMVDPNTHTKGIGYKLMAFADVYAKEKGFTHLRVDTHADNERMKNLILKSKYKYIGYDAIIDRLCYEKII